MAESLKSNLTSHIERYGRLPQTREASVIRASEFDTTPRYIRTPTYGQPDPSSLFRARERYRPQRLLRYHQELNQRDNYWYDTDYVSHINPYSDSYLGAVGHPYRSYVQDTMMDSFSRALEMYRNGQVNFSTLNNYWLTPKYWDRRFKDWRELYSWDSEARYIPSYYDHRVAKSILYYA